MLALLAYFPPEAIKRANERMQRESHQTFEDSTVRLCPRCALNTLIDALVPGGWFGQDEEVRCGTLTAASFADHYLGALRQQNGERWWRGVDLAQLTSAACDFAGYVALSPRDEVFLALSRAEAEASRGV